MRLKSLDRYPLVNEISGRIRSSVQITTITALFFVISGCSTFSKKQCETMDWLEKGRDAAMSGQSAEEGLAYFKRECKTEHDVEPNNADFKKGYDVGLKQFCTPTNIEHFAAGGGHYRGTCPAEDQPKIDASAKVGRLIYLEKEVSRLMQQNASLKSKVDGLESQIRSLESDLSSCKR